VHDRWQYRNNLLGQMTPCISEVLTGTARARRCESKHFRWRCRLCHLQQLVDYGESSCEVTDAWIRDAAAHNTEHFGSEPLRRRARA
jgi:hypothetical protein